MIEKLTKKIFRMCVFNITNRNLLLEFSCRLIVHVALHLPISDSSIDVAAQNCLCNIFKQDDLVKALKEMYRVLKPHGRLVLSDPTCEQPMPESLQNDGRLRALCLSGALPLKEYIKMITDVGFGTVEIRAKRPYRILDPVNYDTEELIFIESVEVCAIKDPMPADGPCVFTGQTDPTLQLSRKK